VTSTESWKWGLGTAAGIIGVVLALIGVYEMIGLRPATSAAGTSRRATAAPEYYGFNLVVTAET
jgi:hypothetical protein